MIEIIFGLLLMIAGAGIASGLGSAFGANLGSLTVLAGGTAAAFGTVLVLHGTFRRVRNRQSDGALRLREAGTVWTVLIFAALWTFVSFSLFGRIKVSGIPVGVGAVSVLLPLVLFALLLAANRKQSSLDGEVPRHDAQL